MSNKHTFNNENIFQHFTEFIDSSMECFICLETIQNAVICPNCKKPACTECFNNWLQKGATCPNCRKELNNKDLMKINLLDEMANLALYFQEHKQNTCQKHNQFLDYYCSLCEVKLCGDCCILEHNRTHPIVHSVDMNKTSYRNLIAKTKEIETYLHTHQTKTMEEIEDQIKHLEKMKINSINLLRKINDNIIKRYDSLINQLNNSKVNISIGISKINELNLQLVDIRNNYSSRKGNDDGISLDDKISTLWKYIIGYQKEINRNINSINQSKMSDIKEIMDYKKITFEVDNYLNIMKQKEYISEKINSPFYEIDFLSWCVRFFPFGTSNAQNKYISLFVGLISSENDYMKYEYEYKFELVNYSGKNNYVKNCVNEFRKNDAFKGYNKFYNIDKLEEDGFIGPNGQITINCYIKPKNFYMFINTVYRYNLE